VALPKPTKRHRFRQATQPASHAGALPKPTKPISTLEAGHTQGEVSKPTKPHRQKTIPSDRH